MKELSHYPVFARLLRYPTSELGNDINTCREILLRKYDPGIVTGLSDFSRHVTETPLAFQQEYYTGTFDVQPVTTLDIGYLLFGDDYRRGVFLVNMQREHIKAGNDCGKELPDHLPDILNLLPLISDPAFTEELVCSLLIPALTEMIVRFRKKENHYRGLLELLLKIIENDFPDSEYERFKFNTRHRVE
ncbi:MAG TPA: hypothetical protein VHO46_06055 [Bacteroidales bacterium]|nr:hypothetical protein [Bacteroidales bacterium]